MSNYEAQEEQTLTVSDRLNYPYLLASQIQALIDVQKKHNFQEEDIKLPINALVSMIPDNIRDKQFTDDIEKCSIRKTVDSRPSFAGRKLSNDICQKLGFEVESEVVEEDPFRTLKVTMDLLQRRKMLLRFNWMEVITGEDYEETLEHSREDSDQ